MIKKLLLGIMAIFASMHVSAQYATPNTGIEWDLNDIMANAPTGVLTFSNGIYTLSQNLTISAGDQLSINEDTTLHVDPNVQITVAGTLIADAEETIITATNPAAPYDSMRFEAGSTVYLENVTINYGKGIRVSTGNFEMHNSSMSFHAGGTITSAALTFSTGNPIVNNSSFISNVVPAFSSGANQEVAATFTANYLENNNTSNTNRPQINMGPSGNDTIRIINNIIKGNPANTLVGGIAVSSLLGNTNRVIIDVNVIYDNRYGITVAGGNSGGYIRGNIIEDNDTQNLPNSGGSGISLSAATAGMNIIASGNEIRRNLWGITLINQANIDLGSDNPADNSPGGNIFANNGNGGNTYALFNNTPLAVSAINNCWIEGAESTAADVENVINHQNDDPALGAVDYLPFINCGALATANHTVAKPVVFPNPNSGQFTVELLEEGVAEFLNLNGQLLHKQNLNVGANDLDLNFPMGLYLMRTETASGTFVTKILNHY
ncbi:MAG TPA: T9SS type A sorting domain-containing protein [Flavobacterium sp.]|jgi:hypothetical protein